MEGGSRYHVRCEVCGPMGGRSKAVEKVKVVWRLGDSLGGGMLRVWRKEGLPSFAKCVRWKMCVNDVAVYEADMLMAFVRFGSTDEGFCRTQDDCNGVMKTIRSLRARLCVMQE